MDPSGGTWRDGASGETDAFLVAWTIPETATPLLMEGAMLLLLVPGDDRVVDARTSLAVAGRFSGEVTVRSYPAFYHEPFHEQGREKVFEDVAAWLEDRID